MGKVEENKKLKLERIMDSAFSLFTSKGIAKTTVADIVQRAGMAKGTFYLYFRDKYELQEKLISFKAGQLISHALEYSGHEKCDFPEDKVIAITDDILNQLEKEPTLLKFINKNLSWGVFRRAMDSTDSGALSAILELLPQAKDQKVQELAIYTIIELVGSTCHSIILESSPATLEEYKPYLYSCVRSVMASFEAMDSK